MFAANSWKKKQGLKLSGSQCLTWISPHELTLETPTRDMQFSMARIWHAENIEVHCRWWSRCICIYTKIYISCTHAHEAYENRGMEEFSRMILNINGICKHKPFMFAKCHHWWHHGFQRSIWNHENAEASFKEEPLDEQHLSEWQVGRLTGWNGTLGFFVAKLGRETAFGTCEVSKHWWSYTVKKPPETSGSICVPNAHYIVFWWKNPWMKIPHDTENNPPTGHLGLGVVAKLRLATPSAIWSFHHHQLSGAKSGLVGESSAGRSVGTPALPRGIFAVPNGGPNRRSFWGAMFGVSVFHRCYGKVR